MSDLTQTSSLRIISLTNQIESRPVDHVILWGLVICESLFPKGRPHAERVCKSERVSATMEKKWAMTDLNRRHLACKASALTN